jgi:hypothetical protein
MSHRSPWAAVGAAVALTLGSGGLFTASATTSSGERDVFVPIAPCRLLDTRPAPDNVGTRNTPLTPGETFIATVRGTNGNCTIPADATGISVNVAIIQPSAASFLTVFPADAPRPLAASLNWIAGQAPTPNAVTARLSTDGKLAFYNLAGTVNVAADVNGYYADHTHDDRYYTKAQLDSGPSNIGLVGRISATQIGLGRWDQDRGRPLDLFFGDSVDSVAFDGAHVWASSRSGSWVKEIDPVSGAVLNTIIDPLIHDPLLGFDGHRIWASNAHGKVLAIDTVSAAIVARITLADGGPTTGGVAFDGSKVWIALPAVGLAEIDPNTDAVKVTPTTGDPTALLVDGTYLWVANPAHSTLSRLTIATRVLTDPLSFLHDSPGSLAFDGTRLWVQETSLPPSSVTRAIDPSTGTYIDPNNLLLATPNYVGTGLAYDGRDLWAAGAHNQTEIVRVDPLTLQNPITLLNPAGARASGAMLFDGSSMWIGTEFGVLKLPDR